MVNYFTTPPEEFQMKLGSWCDTLCTYLLGGGPCLMYIHRKREMLDGENRYKSAKRLSLNFFVAF